MSGDLEIVNLLLPHYDFVSRTVELEIVLSEVFNNGKEVLASFFDASGFMILANAELMAVALNFRSGREIVELLMERGMLDGPKRQVLLRSAAKKDNWKVMAELLEPWDTTAPGELWISAIRSYDTMNVLLNERGAELRDPTSLLKFAIDHVRDVDESRPWQVDDNFSVITLLLRRKGLEIHLTQDIMKTAIEQNVIELVIGEEGVTAHITEELLEFAASAGNDKQFELLLFRLGTQRIKLDGNVLKSILCKGWLARSVLGTRKSEVQITEEPLIAALSEIDSHEAEEVMEYLLKTEEVKIPLTATVLETVLSTTSTQMVWESLIDRFETGVRITEAMLKAAFGRFHNGQMRMEWLLDKCRYRVEVTENVLEMAAKHGNVKVVKHILDRAGPTVVVTESTLIAAFGNTSEDQYLVQMLLKHLRPGRMTHKVRQAAVCFGRRGNLMFLEKAGIVECSSSAWIPTCQLWQGVRNRNVKMVREALATGADPNYRDLDNISPLEFSDQRHNCEIVSLLLDTRNVDPR
ncbi:hypothetical protein LTR84_005202 [Exophiala bonariae]|uniref:Uncharacterized protein n=1 Tax=Exophiala bonariae TaxID=1690606 RepID=A0AAV9NP38_9EURO|nr:hypothetical protein LTR84_005202 [Exophiala bonariae]